MSESWKCYLEREILGSPLLFVLNISISEGIRLHFGLCMLEDFHSYFPCSRGMKKNNPPIKTVAVMYLLCNHFPGLHHPGSWLFGSPLKKLSISISNCLLKPHRGWI